MVKFAALFSVVALLQAATCHGLASTLQRVKNSLANKERSRDELKIGIAGFYDRSSKLWEDVWGEVRLHEIQWNFSNRIESTECFLVTISSDTPFFLFT